MKKMNIRLLAATACTFTLLAVTAQDRRGPVPTPSGTTVQVNGAQPGTAPGAPARTGPKPYKEVITEKAQTQRGLLTLHKVEDKYYFEIPEAIFGKDILVVNRISKGATGVRTGFSGYAGDMISETVINMEKGPNNKVFLRKISYRERGSDSAGMYLSVKNSNMQPIIYGFDVRSLPKKDSTGSTGMVIEVTDLLNSDNDILYFDAGDKRTYGINSYVGDRSYITSFKSFPSNIQIKAVRTYQRTPSSGGFSFGPAPSGPAASEPATFELSSSWILLPEKPMHPRIADDRVGYFSSGYVDFDANPQGVKNIQLIRRWRLEPKEEDVQKYLRGELVEPKKPIVFYIDPTTPKKWVPYLIQGVDDWQVAFEKAGFKNAIYAKMAPTPKEDSSWTLEDARYSAIVYKPSDIPNASGPNTHDPRTGEILESHINWYHNVMELLQNWYFTQTAPVDLKARKMQFDDELMGQLIRFVSSHEVGHTLGLRHNFGSSSTVPVDSLRSKKWLDANGHTPSIMDYARFNYVAQPEDGIDQTGLFPRIGDYDKWAIEWAYRWYEPFKNGDEEKAYLNKWVIEKLKNKRLWWGDGETNQDDPRNQTEDLGDNSMKASSYGVKNLQRIVTNLVEWTKESHEDYTNLQEMYQQVYTQFNRYIGHVTRNIGGIHKTPKRVEQEGAVFEFAAKSKQKEAMSWLQDQVFKTPSWLINKQITSLINSAPQTVISNLQESALNRLFSVSTLAKLSRFEAEAPAEAYTPLEMMNELRRGIFSELSARKNVDVYRRSLQKSFVEKAISLVGGGNAPAMQTGGLTITIGPGRNNDIISVAKAQLRFVQSDIKAALPLVTDTATRIHLQDLNERITDALESK